MIRAEGERFFGVAGGRWEITLPALRSGYGCPMVRFPAVQLQALLGEAELDFSFSFFFASGVGHSVSRISAVHPKVPVLVNTGHFTDEERTCAPFPIKLT
jgi:hypothetical protein